MEGKDRESELPESADAEVQESTMSGLSVIGETGGEASIWTPLQRSVERGSKENELTDDDEREIEKIKEKRQKQYNRERVTAGELGRATSQLRDQLEDILNMVSDEAMQETLSEVREQLEADSYTVVQRDELENALSSIQSEDYGWMAEPDEEIQKSSA